MRIAIIGASNNVKKYSNKAVRAYTKKGDIVFPVNPKEKTVEGLKCYPSVLDIPGNIDAASFYVPPPVGERIAEQIAEKGIKTVYLNPGAESRRLVEVLEGFGIDVLQVCSIREIGEDPERY